MDSSDSTFALAMVLHGLFCLLISFGLVCTVIWLARFATKAQLKSWAWMGLLIGIIGCILTGMAFGSMRSMHERMWDDEEYEGDSYEDMSDRMDEMMDFSDSDAVTPDTTETTPAQ